MTSAKAGKGLEMAGLLRAMMSDAEAPETIRVQIMKALEDGSTCAGKGCSQPATLKCGSCGARGFCGKACQELDWREQGHKSRCPALRRANAVVDELSALETPLTEADCSRARSAFEAYVCTKPMAVTHDRFFLCLGLLGKAYSCGVLHRTPNFNFIVQILPGIQAWMDAHLDRFTSPAMARARAQVEQLGIASRLSACRTTWSNDSTAAPVLRAATASSGLSERAVDEQLMLELLMLSNSTRFGEGVTVALKHLPRLRQRGKSLELAMLLWMTGYSYVKLGSTQEGMPMIQEALTLYEDPELKVRLTGERLKQQRRNRMALSLAPLFRLECYIGLNEGYQRLEEYDKAEPALQEAGRLVSTLDEPWLRIAKEAHLASEMASLAQKRGRLREALGHVERCEQAVARGLKEYAQAPQDRHEFEPFLQSALQVKALVAEAQGDWPTAVETFRAAVASSAKVFGPDHYRTANMHLRLGDALAHMQPAQPHERLAAYERALAVCDPASAPLQGDADPYNQVNQALATYPRVLLCYAEMEQTPVVLGRVHEITERIAVLQGISDKWWSQHVVEVRAKAQLQRLQKRQAQHGDGEGSRSPKAIASKKEKKKKKRQQKQQQHPRQQRGEVATREEDAEGAKQQSMQGGDEAAPAQEVSSLSLGADKDDQPQHEPERDDDEDEEEVVCSVCLEGEDEDEPLRDLQCGHRFHGECIELWRETCTRKSIGFACPYCRQAL